MKIALSAGEESGDILGSNLMDSLFHCNKDIEFIGLGGDRMIDRGLKSLFPYEEISKMGIIDPLLSINNLLRRRKQLIEYFIQERPDFFIGIDSPSFNLGISKKLKSKIGVKTIQYVSPQVWAWRKNRLKKISNYLDHIFCLYRFETKILEASNIKSNFVGHPLAEDIEIEINKNNYKDLLNLDKSGVYVALLPGSRDSEIKNHIKVFFQLVEHYREKNKKLKFILNLTEKSKKFNFESKLQKFENLSISYDDSKRVLSACDYSIVTSGTATLEGALCKTPMIVIYKTNLISYFILSKLIQTKFISLPNILSEKKIVNELIQTDVNKKNLIIELDKLMNEDNNQMALDFVSLHNSLINRDKSKFFDVLNSI